MDDATRNRIVRQHLETERLFGVDAVPVGQAVPVVGHAAPAVEDEENAVHNTEDVGVVASVNTSRGGAATKLTILQDMDANEVRGCTNCELCHSRTNTVFGDGDPDADLMFVGEGPGRNEDEQGRPFVGRAGDLLSKMIVAMGLSREQVYIANIVKCRPPQNRTPTPHEVQACWDYLRRQIKTIQPKVIVSVGGPATSMLLDTKKGITSIRGTWHEYDPPGKDGGPIPVMPTFHPAYLLRSYTKENRAKVWSDLQQAMARLGLTEPA
jgi:uracil-DNA glycosylase family 4